MDFLELYDYDGFRESRKERPHADRLRPGVHRRGVARPQVDALKAAGCKRIFIDKVSTTKADHPGLADAVSRFRHADALVIWKLDRLGRTVKGLVDFVADLHERQIRFRNLADGIDTATPAGRFFFPVMASLARIERELLADRTRAGFAGAQWRGRVGGRERRMTPRNVESARELL